jgi:uncharacterized protein (UPF0548 family)
MRSLKKPDAEAIQRFLAAQSDLELTYRYVGATATKPPSGYVVDHTRVLLGNGEVVFDRAMVALLRWNQFGLGWVEARPAETTIRVGECICILARCFGLWWLNACRIVYVEDDGPASRFGFAYGSLPGHVGSGEERFLVEMDDSGQVWYDVLAFSRPEKLVSRIGYRFLRQIQQRFGPESAAAMQHTVSLPRLATDESRMFGP